MQNVIKKFTVYHVKVFQAVILIINYFTYKTYIFFNNFY